MQLIFSISFSTFLMNCFPVNLSHFFKHSSTLPYNCLYCLTLILISMNYVWYLFFIIFYYIFISSFYFLSFFLFFFFDAFYSGFAAAKSLQSCPTLCDPRDGSPPGSPVPGIFQARTLEWIAISFSNAWKWKVKVKSLSRVWPLATPWTAAYQAPLSMGFSRQEYWSGVPLFNNYLFLFKGKFLKNGLILLSK